MKILMRLFNTALLFLLFTIHSEGQVLYTKCIQFCGIPGAYKKVIDQRVFDSSSDIITAGYGTGGYNKFFISRNDSLYNLLWSKEFEYAIQDTFFGSTDTLYLRRRTLHRIEKFQSDHTLFALDQDSVVYKFVNPTSTFARYGIKSSLLGRLDSNGNPQWVKIVKSNIHNSIRHICANDDRIYFGGVYRESYFQSNDPGNQMFICTDTSGNVVWTTLIPNSSSRKNITMINHLNSGFLVMSNDSSGAHLMKFEKNGNITWANRYSTSNKVQGVDLGVLPDGSIILLVNYHPASNKPGLMKLDPSGNIIWAIALISSLDPYPKQLVEQGSDTTMIILQQYGSSPRRVISVKMDPNGLVNNGNVFFENSWGSSPSFPTSGGEDLLSVNRQGSGYLGNVEEYFDDAKFGIHARYVKTIRFNRLMNSCYYYNYDTPVSSIPVAVSKKPFTVGDSSATLSAEAYSLLFQPAVYAIENSCVSNVGLPETSPDEIYTIFPNPTRGSFTLKTQGKFMKYELSIYNQFGQKVYQTATGTMGENVSVILPDYLPNGVYLVSAVLDGTAFHSKLILINN
jgi:hypothetical protein